MADKRRVIDVLEFLIKETRNALEIEDFKATINTPIKEKLLDLSLGYKEFEHTGEVDCTFHIKIIRGK